jgi:hypothetical protein
LVEHFERHADTYRSAHYNEAQVRKEFIEPFFKCLGWDIDNERCYAEPYKDVVHEDSIKVGGALKAPDYCFRVGGTRKFFLEAKRPSVNIWDDPAPAFQLRRYAWSAQLPLSTLTDFEEFAVYDCRVKPARADKASTARVLYLTFTDYAQRWDDIAAIFSREAVLKGAFDRFSESNKAKKGTAAVDAEFLKDIESWRDLLARNFALRNQQLTQRELNFAVQVTLDRILFLRMCEDRGIEQYGQLAGLLTGPSIYRGLLGLYTQADDRYNSGLFHFRPEKSRPEAADVLTPVLAVDDRPLQQILRGLYYPDSPYEFSVIPPEILGQVYEQFLGKVIRLTPGHRAVVEDKPEVKKAGGVYYTPSYIVGHIVERTLGKLLEGKTPRQASVLKILDPACGSGSFLLGAYQYLLDWHLAQYVADGPEKHSKELWQGPRGEWDLTTAARKRILLSSIYGVDIDPQAVETTKLSLLLKVLESENRATLERQRLLWQERALPDLGQNIKCGNSLVGPDFYADRQQTLFDEEDRYRVNAFDWEAEFGSILRAGGFDAVIGNPPYGALLTEEERAYLKRRFEAGTTDTAALFMVQGRRLTRAGGWNAFIVPKPFTYSSNWEQVRADLLGELRELVDVGKVWKAVKLEQVIYTLNKNRPQPEYACWKRQGQTFIHSADIGKRECGQYGFYLNGIETAELAIARTVLGVGAFLGDFATNTRGGMLQGSVGTDPGGWRVVGGKQVQRFRILGQKGYLPQDAELPPQALVQTGGILVQNIVAHIANPVDHIKIIGAVPDAEEAKRLVILDTVNQLANHSKLSSHYLLGLLLSRLMNWYVYRFIFAKAIRTMHFDGPVTDRLPIRDIDFTDAADRSRHDRVAALAELQAGLKKREGVAKSPDERIRLERQMNMADRQLDQLVYDLYGLTDEAARIVDASFLGESCPIARLPEVGQAAL